MIIVPRNDTSVVGRWWWTVDRWSLGAVLLIMAVGVMLTMAASPRPAMAGGLVESENFGITSRAKYSSDASALSAPYQGG